MAEMGGGGLSEVRCGRRRCKAGLLFVARNRRAFLTKAGWSNTRRWGWICPDCCEARHA